MRAICVDDEPLLSEHIAKLCIALKEIDEAFPFTRAEAALQWLEGNAAELALLDIDMPDMNGIDLAKIIKLRHPWMKVIFLTSYPQYAVDAFHLHVSGYLLKPVDPDELKQEVNYALSDRVLEKPEPPVRIRTFGGFDVFVNGRLVAFSQAKCKELFAFLVDRQGNSVTRMEAFSILWEDREYDRTMQKRLDNIIRSMRDTLEEYGIGEVFELRRGTLRARPELFTCDAHQFFKGDIDAVAAYRGEYMPAYSWASITESYMDFKSANK